MRRMTDGEGATVTVAIARNGLRRSELVAVVQPPGIGSRQIPCWQNNPSQQSTPGVLHGCPLPRQPLQEKPMHATLAPQQSMSLWQGRLTPGLQK